MKHAYTTGVCLAGLAVCTACFIGATGSLSGKGERFWTRHALVVARVTDVGVDTVKGGEYVEIKPIGTVTGVFDASLNPTVRLPFFVAGNSAFTDRPTPDAIALILLGEKTDKDGSLGDFYLPTSRVEFLPSRCAIWEFDSLDDDQFLATLRAISDIRLENNETAGHD